MMNILKTLFPFFFEKEEQVKTPPRVVTAKATVRPAATKAMKAKIKKTIEQSHDDLVKAPKKRGRPPKAKK
tara:strand:+ start:228 stop:440 length:213 start_codon:yes stop_codon:yes gene_type:complete